MLKTKMFEIRDRCTFIPVMATRMVGPHEAERYLLERAGYGQDEDNALIVTTRIEGNLQSCYSDYQWQDLDQRTMPTAHNYIFKHWAELESGDVVDVEFILGETSMKKESERLGE